ncbi:amino acid ABC transporter ATP-binding protein [Desulfotignum balticum]|nr:amino acid ABC transporter ATP-binding protein [Desulfotignum balticum]
MDPLIRVDRISKSYGSHMVLKDISLEIRQGEILAVIGPSGAGKSTFIRCLNGLEKVDKGSVTVDGQPVTSFTSVAGRMGMVFQQFNLFPHYTAIENIAAPLRTIKNMPRTRARDRAAELLESVKLADKASQYPSTLSGGQQQRLAIARALSMSPDIMLFDEPTSSLDPELAHEVFDTIQTLARSHMTLVLVTHQMNMVKNFATRVLFLENGGIFFDGTFEDLTSATDPRIRQFLKKIYP